MLPRNEVTKEKLLGTSTDDAVREIPNQLHVIKRHEDVIQEGQKEDCSIFEDGTG
jgi:hypothetical protein